MTIERATKYRRIITLGLLSFLFLSALINGSLFVETIFNIGIWVFTFLWGYYVGVCSVLKVMDND